MAQVLTWARPSGQPVVCKQLNDTVLTHVAAGQWEQAESAALAGADRLCAGVVLSNAAGKIILEGRPAEAERFAQKSLGILKPIVAPDDPALLRPLHLLSASRLYQNKLAQSREAFRYLALVRMEGPQDRALVRGMEAMLLEAEGKLHEAESKYYGAIGAWQEAGLGEAAETAVLLNALGALYVKQHRFGEARQALNRALEIFDADNGTVPLDLIRAHYTRGILYTRQGEWRNAAEDLREAIAFSAGKSPDTALMVSLLSSYAVVLRKTHRSREARSFDARAAALRVDLQPRAIIDVTELAPQSR
ncbi:MAG TPA: tetratricopeptide repeat protein [Bryobacteraceae bacterium]|nr:tetratricopeptide repeat protein [Bryobacteraceae bacterium]